MVDRIRRGFYLLLGGISLSTNEGAIMPENSMADLMKFFSTDENKVKPSEFREFWATLSDEEKEHFKNADIS